MEIKIKFLNCIVFQHIILVCDLMILELNFIQIVVKVLNSFKKFSMLIFINTIYYKGLKRIPF